MTTLRALVSSPAAIRAARTFVAAFLVLYPADRLAAAAAGATPVDWPLLRAAAVSGAIAVVSFAWRQWLDPSRIPSLRDPDQT